MNFQIELIDDVTENTVKNKKGQDDKGITLAYRQLDGNQAGQVASRRFPEWANKEIYPSLLSLKRKEVVTVTAEKVNDFWKWLTVSNTGDNSENTSQPGVPSQLARANVSTTPAASRESKAFVGKAAGSTYSTAAERAEVQRYIVRQSSLSNAIALIAANNPKGLAKDVFTVEYIVEMAKRFEAYVFSKEANDFFSDMTDDIPQ